MRRDYLIAVILFVAGLGAAVSLMAAPEYLHLSPANVSITFWSGAILALIFFIAAAITAFRAGKVGVHSVENMTLADIGFNTALAGGAATLAAAVFNVRRTAIVACIIAWTGIGIDYWWGPPRGFLWSAPPNTLASKWALKGEPLGWSQPLLDNFVFLPSGKPTNITDISIVGGNVGDKEIKLDEAYFLSGIDGTRIDAKISWAGSASMLPKPLEPFPHVSPVK